MPVVLRGEIAFPTNPNGVLFSCDARVALAQSWRTLQAEAHRGLERFHSNTGLDVVAFFGRRLSMSRRNEMQAEVTLTFVFDGSGDAQALELLDRWAVDGLLHWEGGAIESVPSAAFPSLCAKSGRIYQIWAEINEQPRALSLALRDEAIHVERLAPEQASARDFLPYVVHVVGKARDRVASDVHLDRLRIAFALHFARLIVEADGVVSPDELAFLGRAFPPDMVAGLGLDNPEALAEARDQALAELGALLGYQDKLALIGLLFSACHSDGAADYREIRVLKQVADVLNLSGDEVVRYWRRIF